MLYYNCACFRSTRTMPLTAAAMSSRWRRRSTSSVGAALSSSFTAVESTRLAENRLAQNMLNYRKLV